MATATPALFARLCGTIEFACPYCDRFRWAHRINIRRPRRKCNYKYCDRWVDFGIRGSAVSDTAPLLEARFDPHRGNSHVANYAGEVPGGRPAIGHIIGFIEWWCPCCATYNHTRPARGVGCCGCSNCGVTIFFSLVLSAPVQGAHIVTPVDWIAPSEEQQHEMVLHSESAREHLEGPAADSRRRGVLPPAFWPRHSTSGHPVDSGGLDLHNGRGVLGA